MKKYDFLIVGAGLFGAVCGYELAKKGKTCLVIEKRAHIGGNIYTKTVENIHVHYYGAHIFHTSSHEIWEYMKRFTDFNHFINSPLASYKGEIYNLPFNMNTFYKMWGTSKPKDAMAILDKQRNIIKHEPQNLEEQAISLVGSDIYEMLIKGYTEKQWGRKCSDLPTFIIKRLPVRMTYNNNYFDDIYQGIPTGGYTKMVDAMLKACDLRLNVNYLEDKKGWNDLAGEVIYTGPIDAYYDYCYGNLEYRSIRFETEVLEEVNYQGNAVINYTDSSVPYTRIIEHKHFNFGQQEKTVISREFSEEWSRDKEPYYPINDDKNSKIYDKYHQKASEEKRVYFGGRLGDYKYYNMDKTVESALALCRRITE